MEMKRYYLAIDIGASSGRHIVGWREDGEIKAKEVYRFPNGVQEQNGHLVWDVDALLSHVKAGIAAAKAEFPEIVSLSVDTWAVDYVLLRGEEEVRPVYAYRDSRTEAAIPKVHETLPFAELYAKTGCQFQPFNSIYQLYADQLAGRLEGVTDFLMIPEYLLWKLCGVKAKEYTNATTTGMVNAETGKFDPEIISALGLPPIFPKLQKPGTVLGEYEGIKCVLCATHDTASAVEVSLWTGASPTFPPVHGRSWVSKRRSPLQIPPAVPPITPTRAAWAITAIRRTSWACGWSTSCKRSFAAGWALRRS